MPRTAGMYDYHRECQTKRPRSLNYMGAPRASLRRVEQSKSITWENEQPWAASDQNVALKPAGPHHDEWRDPAGISRMKVAD